MSSKKRVKLDAAVRIEVLRARAALERLTLAGHVEQLTQEANPLTLALGLVRGRKRGWLKNGVDFLGKYPMILSVLTTILLGRSSGLARAGGIALSAAQSMIEKQGTKSSSSF
jgi:hypothetical protein